MRSRYILRSKRFTIAAVTIAVSVVAAIGLVIRLAPEDKIMTSTPNLHTHPIYSKYAFSKDPKVIDFGIQPLWIPTNVIIEVMKRDEILSEGLNKLGITVRYHNFLKGDDVNFFLKSGDIEAGIGEDIPAILAAARMNAYVVSLTQFGFCSIVAAKPTLIKSLRGKRIGFAFGSNAHYSLLQALDSAGLSQKDVVMVPMEVSEMPRALEEEDIDAFSAWEPTPTIALANPRGPTVIRRSLTSGYMYFSRDFADRNGKATRQIIAAQIRALNWMQLRRANLLVASGWSLDATTNMSGVTMGISLATFAALAENDLLGISPILGFSEKHLSPAGRLSKKFAFLKSLGRIPNTTTWSHVRECFDSSFAREIIADSRRYRIEVFRYSAVEKAPARR